MNKLNIVSFYFALCLSLLIFLLGLVAIAGYYASPTGIHYTEALRLDAVLAGVRAIKPSNLQQALTIPDFVYLIALTAAFVVFRFTINQKKSFVRVVVFGLQPIILFWGWMGLAMIPATLLEGIDGEWLAEHWPTLIATGVWVAYSAYLALASFDSKWITRRASQDEFDLPEL